MIETSYSQHHKELTRLADEYVSGSDDNTAVILGLDIEYGVGSRTASLFIWRPRVLPDTDEKEAVLLEAFSVREADVMLFLLAHYQSVSALVQCRWLFRF